MKIIIIHFGKIVKKGIFLAFATIYGGTLIYNLRYRANEYGDRPLINYYNIKFCFRLTLV